MLLSFVARRRHFVRWSWRKTANGVSRGRHWSEIVYILFLWFKRCGQIGRRGLNGYFGRPCVVSCGLSLSVPCRHRGRFSAGCDNRHLNLILAHFLDLVVLLVSDASFFAEPRIFLNRLQAARRLRGESYDDGMSANCTAGQVVRWHNAARHMPISCNFSRLWSSDVVKSTKVQSKSEALRIKSESSWSQSESLGVHSKSYDYESRRESSHTQTHTV